MKTLYLKTDSKNRILLTKATQNVAPIYKVYLEGNRIILEPIEEKQQETHWLLKPENKHILIELEESLKDKEKFDLGSFKKYL